VKGPDGTTAAWAFEFGHGHTDPSAAAFEERSRRARVVSVRLLELDGSPGRPLRAAAVGIVPASHARTVAALGDAAADLLAQAASDWRAGIEPLASAAAVESFSGPRRPSYLVRMDTARALLRRKLFALTKIKAWQIGLGTAAPDDVLAGRLGRVRWLPPEPGGMLADPFFVPSQPAPTLLCEAFTANGKGMLVRVVLDDTGGSVHVREKQPLLEIATHLSFPSIVIDEDRWWCVLESGESGRLQAYPIDHECRVVGPPVTLLEGFAAVDPVVFRWEGQWWIAATEHGPEAGRVLYLFHAPELTGPWEPHRANPVLADPRFARGAGPALSRDGHVYRLAQDCAQGYGQGVHILRIDELDELRFRETLVATITPRDVDSSLTGFHTLGLGDDDRVVVDGYREELNPRDALIRTGRRLRARFGRAR
jgi:hypothetical protein